MANLHHHYNQLNANEKAFVDASVNWILAQSVNSPSVPKLNNCDPAERAVDAFARWILESKK